MGYNKIEHHEDPIEAGAGRVGYCNNAHEGHDVWSVQVKGTFNATLTFQATIDGTNWFSVGMYNFEDPADPAVTSTTAAGAFWCPVPGVRAVRVLASDVVDGDGGSVTGALSS